MDGMRGHGASDCGRVRESNEDSWLVDDRVGLYVVSDGMGGHRAGEVASGIAVEAVAELVRNRHAGIATDSRGQDAAMVDVVEQAVQHANRVVLRAGAGDGRLTGMGCTLTVLLCCGDKAAMAHVGDSRLYLLRGGAARQLSTDHTLAAELVRAGVVEPERAKSHPGAHVLSRVVGHTETVKVETTTFAVQPGDRFLLCSDGLSNYLETDAELAALADLEDDALPKALVGFANERGGDDNVTVVYARVPGVPPPAPARPAEVRMLTQLGARLGRLFGSSPARAAQ